jgi:hypothetical protein
MAAAEHITLLSLDHDDHGESGTEGFIFKIAFFILVPSAYGVKEIGFNHRRTFFPTKLRSSEGALFDQRW